MAYTCLSLTTVLVSHFLLNLCEKVDASHGQDTTMSRSLSEMHFSAQHSLGGSVAFHTAEWDQDEEGMEEDDSPEEASMNCPGMCDDEREMGM